MLGWAQRWGLLGVGLVGLRQVVTHPRYYGRSPGQNTFNRIAGWWTGFVEMGVARHGVTSDAIVAVGTDDDGDSWAAPDRNAHPSLKVWQKPRAVYADHDGAEHSLPVGVLSRFFPAVEVDEVAESWRQRLYIERLGFVRASLPNFKDQWDYPFPTETDWWAGYGETPVMMLVGTSVDAPDAPNGRIRLPGAQDLRSMWQGLTSPENEESLPLDKAGLTPRQWGFIFARRLMADVRLVPTESGLMVELPTVLATLARALFDDAVGGKTLRRCAVCASLLLATRQDTVTCSDRCSGTLRQRRRRQDPTTGANKVTAMWKAKPEAEKPTATYVRIAQEMGWGTRTDKVKTILKGNGYYRTPSNKLAPNTAKRRR
jgi:hypothetical protein